MVNKQMVNKQKSRRQRNIKGKLMAAACMLLVSAIMMVSTTYAWFTLSTAPEVKGITTAVGANGNLEMALLPLNGQLASIGENGQTSMATNAVTVANVSWGNLVDLGSTANTATTYGLENITLYPAALNLDATSKLKAAPLQIPKYGADGRVSTLDDSSTTTGVYQTGTKSGFYEGTTVGTDVIQKAYGVRAVGTISGLTDRQLAYRNALQEASTGSSNAQKIASDSLKTNGNTLANIAVKKATNDPNGYNRTEIETLQSLIKDLVGYDTPSGETTVHTTGALEYIEQSIKQYMVAAAASNTKGSDSYQTAKDAILVPNAELSALTQYVPGDMTDMVTALATAITDAESALTKVNALLDADTAKETSDATKGKFTWDEIKETVMLIADPDYMRINGIEVNKLNEQAKDAQGNLMVDDDNQPITNISKLVGSALTNGLNLTMASGAGVYADIADFCGDYSATITIDKLYYGGMTAYDLPATMSTATTVNPVYLKQADTLVRGYGAPTGTSSEAMPISDYYGYIIDLAFRTNVADSYLQLQTDAIDRIYSENTANPDTMGGGSTMSFKSIDTGFTTSRVMELMKCLNVVFFHPDDGTILGYAKLDPDSTVTGADSTVTMNLVMWDMTASAAKTGEDAPNIIELQQNKAQKVSVLVYLNGKQVGNDDVANAAKSVTGKMNLQFSSSADLKPMEYTDLKEGSVDGTQTPAATPTTVSTDKVSITGGGTATAAYLYNGKIGVVIDGVTGTSGKTVTIDGAAATYGAIGTNSAWVADTTKTATDTFTVVVADTAG